MQSNPDNPGASRKPLVVIFLTVFLDLLGAGILLPIIPYLVRQFRADATTLGVLSMAFSGAQFVASPVLGVLSDRFGRRPVLLLSIFGTSVGYFLFATATSLPMMFFSRLLDGFTGGNISTAQAYIADITPPADRAKSFGLIGMAFGLGFILGPAIGGALANISVHAPAFAAGVLSLFTAVLAYFVLPESLPAQQRETKPFHWLDLSPVRPLRQVWERKNLHMLLMAVFVLNFAFSSLPSNFSLFTLTRFQYTPQQNAILFAFIGLTAAIVQGYLVRRLNPILGERKMAVMGIGLMVAGFIGIAFSTVPWHLYVAVLLVSGVGFASTAQTAMLSHRVSAREQGWLLGSMQSFLSLTRVAGPLYAGAVFDLISPGAPYWTGAIWLTVALVLTWYGATRE
ncbi:MAG: MFS transporter [Acidobacteria bacterium]|nr:MFS transporter [Acidobacteriota bacterium]